MKNKIFFFLSFFLITGCVSSVSKPAVKTQVVQKQPEKEKVLYVFLGKCNPELTKYVMAQTNAFYGFDNYSDTTVGLPSEAYSSLRGRYKADGILGYLQNLNTNNYKHVIGFINKDICTPKNGIADYGIYGLGTCPGNVCITSSFRLKENFDKCLQVVIHEVGHNKGLPHCPNERCLMADAKGGAVKIYTKSPWMCDSCRAKINKGRMVSG